MVSGEVVSGGRAAAAALAEPCAAHMALGQDRSVAEDAAAKPLARPRASLRGKTLGGALTALGTGIWRERTLTSFIRRQSLGLSRTRPLLEPRGGGAVAAPATSCVIGCRPRGVPDSEGTRMHCSIG